MLQKINNRQNDIEQYYPRNIVRIYGIEDTNPNETPHQTTLRAIQTLKDKLHLDVGISVIDIAHRTGQFLKDGDKPIICKFVTSLKRLEVIESRKTLKDTSMHFVLFKKNGFIH